MWNIAKANWLNYKEAVKANLTGWQASDINQYADQVTKAIIEAAKLSVPLNRQNKRFQKKLPYWSKKCDEAVSARNRARKKLNKHNTEENLISYKRSKGVAQAIIKSESQNCWKNYCSSLNRNTKLGPV